MAEIQEGSKVARAEVDELLAAIDKGRWSFEMLLHHRGNDVATLAWAKTFLKEGFDIFRIGNRLREDEAYQAFIESDTYDEFERRVTTEAGNPLTPEWELDPSDGWPPATGSAFPSGQQKEKHERGA